MPWLWIDSSKSNSATLLASILLLVLLKRLITIILPSLHVTVHDHGSNCEYNVLIAFVMVLWNGWKNCLWRHEERVYANIFIWQTNML